MTLSAITGTQHVQQPATATQAAKKPAAAKSQPSAGTQDTVHLSGAAQSKLSAMKAAVQEASETPAQTAQEAQSGDLQAQRLLSREAAAAKAERGA